MAMNAYLSVKGQKQGSMKGSSTKKGHGSWSEVISISSGTLTPRDPQSGLPSGKRQHQPIKIVREVDAASPQLLEALWSNEPVDVEIGLSTGSGAPSSPGVTLKNGTIVSINPYFGPKPWGHRGNWYEEVVVAFPELSAFELQYLAQLSPGA